MYKKMTKKINFRTSTLLKYFSTLGLVRLGRNVPNSLILVKVIRNVPKLIYFPCQVWSNELSLVINT